MSDEIIFIVSAARSGSTLLDQLLGAHPEVRTVGEIHHLVAYATNDRSRYDPVHPLQCTCGHEISACPFWVQVEKQIGRPLADLRIKPRFLDKGRRGKAYPYLKRILHSSLQSHPAGFFDRSVQRLFCVPGIARDSFAVFDAIFETTDTKYIVDASKNFDRFRILGTAQPERMRLILLSRDYRGVVYSKMKRGRPLEASAANWVKTMRGMSELGASMPDDRVHRVRYEDLCTDPAGELQKICAYLSLPFTENMLIRPDADIHHIGGSPSKFQTGRREIKQDREFDAAFTATELQSLKKIVGDAGKDWGYD